jgi:hypothetical protein
MFEKQLSGPQPSAGGDEAAKLLVVDIDQPAIIRCDAETRVFNDGVGLWRYLAALPVPRDNLILPRRERRERLGQELNLHPALPSKRAGKHLDTLPALIYKSGVFKS